MKTENNKSEQSAYHFKESYFKRLTGAHVRSMKYLQAIARDFKVLGIGEITMKDLQLLFNGDNFDAFQNRYQASIEDEIKKIKNPLIRNNMTEGSGDIYDNWKSRTEVNVDRFNLSRTDRSFALDTPDHLSVDHYTALNGEIFFTEENSEFLKTEYCQVYVNSEAQKRFVELTEQTLKGLQEIKNILIKNNIGPVFSVPGEDIGIFDETGEEVVLSLPEAVEYVKEA